MIVRHPLTQQEIRVEVSEWLPGCAYYRCPATGFEWLDPQPPGVPVFPDFSTHARRLLTEATREKMEQEAPVNEHAALEWVEANIPPGGRVLELFAETGRFAWLLRDRGYEVRLADPLASHRRVLVDNGFAAVQALDVSTLPADWPQPHAVVVLESIVRLPDPLAFIQNVRARFPAARILLTAPSMRRPLKLRFINNRAGYPPDFMTRWTPAALELLLATAGYEARGFSITPRATREFPWGRWKWKLLSFAFAVQLWLAGEYEFSSAASGLPHGSAPP